MREILKIYTKILIFLGFSVQICISKAKKLDGHTDILVDKNSCAFWKQRLKHLLSFCCAFSVFLYICAVYAHCTGCPCYYVIWTGIKVNIIFGDSQNSI